MIIGLTLGGGGARGGAHIGVIEELNRLGIRPGLITGASIGGVIGALYSLGLPTNEMVTFLERLRVGNIYVLPRSLFGLVTNERLEQLLVETIGRPTFADLPIPLAVTAVDVRLGRLLVLKEGDLVSALLATTAVPGFLPPVEREGLLLADGGLLDNTPFDVARALGATDILAIDLSNVTLYTDEFDEPLEEASLIERGLATLKRATTLRVLLASLDIMTAHIVFARTSLNYPEIMVRPFLGTLGSFDFHRVREAVEAGRKAFLESEPRIKEILIDRRRPADPLNPEGKVAISEEDVKAGGVAETAP